MKALSLKFSFIIALMFAFASCNNPQNRTDDNANDGGNNKALTEVVYTCPMHPEVTAEEPGDCPKCGMDLVKAEELKRNQGADSLHDTLNL